MVKHSARGIKDGQSPVRRVFAVVVAVSAVTLIGTGTALGLESPVPSTAEAVVHRSGVVAVPFGWSVDVDKGRLVPRAAPPGTSSCTSMPVWTRVPG